MIYCLMIGGPPLSDSARDALFFTAVAMSKDGQESRKVTHDDVIATITTEYEHANLGTIAGVVFDADVVLKKGINKVRYIVQTSDLEEVDKAKWMTLNPKPKRNKYDPSQN